MRNNRIVTIMLLLLTTITLVGTIVIVVTYMRTNQQTAGSEPTIDQVLEASVDISDITTNLENNDYIRMSFKIQTDSKEAKEELEKRDFQVRNIIIQELSEKSNDDLKGKNGKIQLEVDLKGKINEIMQSGEVVQVFITDSLLQ
ncbi:flagellar basal body-associated protein FliL [Bacillaceae bacterium Marseille-Q3522]|nr:flagellar basal body-associated protein FliL [Bacillaceae bacterium Marseille-Q3522]